jgi:hypothetical protein
VTEQGSSLVECYSGHTYPQEPRVVVWQGSRLPVTHIERRWRRPRGPAFSVETEQGISFKLSYDERDDLWTIQPYPGFDLDALESTQQAKDLLEGNNHNHDEAEEVMNQP